MIKKVLLIVLVLVGLSLMANNFIRVALDNNKDSIGIIEHTIYKNSEKSSPMSSAQMGSKLINLSMPDGFIDYRNSKIKSLELLYEQQSNISNDDTIVLMGADKESLNFIKSGKGVESKITRLIMLYENGSKASIFTPEILYRMEDAYKDGVLEFSKATEYTEQGTTIIEEDLFQESSGHPLYVMRIVKRTIKPNNGESYKTISANPMALINEKVFHLQIEREFESQDDIDFVIKVAKEWGNKLLSIN